MLVKKKKKSKKSSISYGEKRLAVVFQYGDIPGSALFYRLRQNQTKTEHWPYPMQIDHNYLKHP